MTHETTQRFQMARHWWAWHEWPGVVALATGLALWIFFAVGVVAPLADALARLGAPAASGAPACCPAPLDEALAAAAEPCAEPCPEPPARSAARRG
jgi:hypothetical protein